MYLLCNTVMLLARRCRFTREPEGVGFEPTVGYPTLDFESSALNRTQPPFLEAKKHRKFNVEQPTVNATAVANVDGDVDESACENCRVRRPLFRETALSTNGEKNVTILSLPRIRNVLHLVCPHGRPRYYLLLTGIHRFLAPLFTSIGNLFKTSTLPHRHDSTQTWNSTGFTK